MKKKICFVFALFFVLLIGGCSKDAQIDYSTEQAETALNNGENIDGKVVKITVDKLVPASAYGYNIQTGDHLNFVSSSNPNVKEGDSLNVKVKEVQSTLGSFIITYEKVK